jgi:hypothetical protein
MNRAKTNSLKHPNIINIDRNYTTAPPNLSALFSSTYTLNCSSGQ